MDVAERDQRDAGVGDRKAPGRQGDHAERERACIGSPGLHRGVAERGDGRVEERDPAGDRGGRDEEPRGGGPAESGGHEPARKRMAADEGAGVSVCFGCVFSPG